MVLACSPKADDPTTETADTTATTATTTDSATGTTATTTTTTTTTPTTTDTATTTAATTADTTTDTTMGMVDAPCPNEPATNGCCCFSEAGQGDNFTENICPASPLCEKIEASCDDYDLPACPLDMLSTTSDAAIDCALQALVAGGAGKLEWSVDLTVNPGQGGHEAVLLPVGDGTAFRTGFSFFDLGASVEEVSHFTLKPKDYFMGCQKLATAAERFICLRDGRDGAPIQSCIEAYITDYF